jgi:hypothetical protein
MDQANKYFTQAIVGEPRKVVLGVLSRGADSPSFGFPDMDSSRSVSAPWNRFIPRLVLGRKVLRDAAPEPSRFGGRLAYVLVGLSLVAGVAAILAVGSGHGQNQEAAETSHRSVEADTAVAPPAAPSPPPAVDNISIADTIFEADEESAPSDTEQRTENVAHSLPFGPAEQREVVPAKVAAAPKAVVPQKPIAPLPTTEEARPVPPVPKAPPAPKQSEPAARSPAPPKQQDQDQEPPPPAVIVDMSKAPQKVMESPAVPVEQREPVSTGQRRLVGPVQESSPQPSTTSGQGNSPLPTVVDIGPDGTYVLITNPSTRLPQRFTTGQKIFTGETIQKIDAKSGSVQLDTRTIKMQ